MRKFELKMYFVVSIYSLVIPLMRFLRYVYPVEGPDPQIQC